MVKSLKLSLTLALVAIAALFTAPLSTPALAQPEITRPGALPGVIPNTRDATQIDIASGAVTPSRATHLLGAESGTADDLVTITATAFNAGAAGSLIVATGDTITVKTTGNIATFDGEDLVATPGMVINWRRNEAGTGVLAWLSGAGSGADFESLKVFVVDEQAGADDQARAQAAIDAAEVAGGVVEFTARKTYTFSGCTTRCLLINSSNVIVNGNGATLASTGSAAAFNILEVRGVDNVASTTLAGASSLGALTISLTSATGFAVGDLIRIDQNKTVTTTFTRTYYARITNLSGTTATLEAPLPFEVGPAVGTTSVTKVTPVENIVIRDLIIDKTAQTVSSGNIQGALFVTNMANSLIENIRFKGNNNHFAFQTFWGYRNTYRDLFSENGGGGSTIDADLQVGRESFTAVLGLASTGSDGFGINVDRSAYMTVRDIRVTDTTRRGLKLESTVTTSGGDWFVSDAGTTGIMLARGTSYNTLSGIVTINNGVQNGEAGDNYGLWLDNDDNLQNQISNVVALGNTDDDLFVHETNTNNQFSNVRISGPSSCRNLGGSSNKIFGLNGQAVADCADGAGAGPEFSVSRFKKDAAANNDFGPFVPFRMKNSAGSYPAYCYFQFVANVVTAGSEDGTFQVRCLDGGVDTPVFSIGANGAVIGSPTGGAQGVGTLNVDVELYKDGVVVGGGATNPLTITLSDDGSASGPEINLERNSASPANGDNTGVIRFRAKDSAGNTDPYAYIQGTIVDPTTTSEDGTIQFGTAVAGAFAARGYFQAGLVVGSPTGADKGVGTINATAVYDDNVLLTDYVFDLAYDGALHPDDRDDPNAITFDRRLLDPDYFAAKTREARALPGFVNRRDWSESTRPSTGKLLQDVWEIVEVQAIHIETLNAKIKAQSERLSAIEEWACANDNAPPFCEAVGQ